MIPQFPKEVYHTFEQSREVPQIRIKNWIPLQVAIESWPGIDTPVTLVLRTQTDWAFPTDFTIDQVNLMTACLSE